MLISTRLHQDIHLEFKRPYSRKNNFLSITLISITMIHFHYFALGLSFIRIRPANLPKRTLLKRALQKMQFSIKDFFSKCDQICSFLRIWSHLLKKSLMENFNDGYIIKHPFIFLLLRQPKIILIYLLIKQQGQ